MSPSFLQKEKTLKKKFDDKKNWRRMENYILKIQTT